MLDLVRKTVFLEWPLNLEQTPTRNGRLVYKQLMKPEDGLTTKIMARQLLNFEFKNVPIGKVTIMSLMILVTIRTLLRKGAGGRGCQESPLTWPFP